MSTHRPPRCPGMSRRTFLADTGMGFTGLALSALLFRDGVARADNPPPDGRPHFPPKARSVIWIFLCGGVSHVESFDPKPELNRYHGRTIDETPYRAALNPERLRDVIGGNPAHGGRRVLMGLNTGHRRHGQSGLAVADWWRHCGALADDIAVVRSLWTNHNDHGAQLTWHTGRHIREGAFPTIGSWVSYGLGTLNQDLPEYVVLGTPTGDCCGGSWTHGAAYLGAEHAGVRLNVGGREPLSFVAPAGGATAQEQRAELELLGRLNRLAAVEYPDDAALRRASAPTSWPPACRPPCRRRCSWSARARRRRRCTAWTGRRRDRSGRCAWRRGGWWSAACVSCSCSTAAAAAGRGTRTAASAATTATCRRRWTPRSRAWCAT